MRMRQSVRVVGDETPLCARELSALPRADILRVDLETVARGLDRLRAEAGDTKHPTLFVPVSYTSLSSTRGCGQVVALLKEASSHVRQGLICEITDIEGVPQSALTAAIAVTAATTCTVPIVPGNWLTTVFALTLRCASSAWSTN